MAENTTETLIGAGVLAVAAGFFLFASSATQVANSNGAYELKASFRSVEGVTAGTDVRLAGVKIGSVSSLALDPVTFRADLTFSIREDLALPDDSSVLISSEGLLGGTFVEIVPGGSDINLGPGEEIEDTQSAVSLINLLLRFVSGSGEQ